MADAKSKPISAHDVAAYIVGQRGTLTAMKLQKLVYYSQAWSLVWEDAPLFSEQIEAWANGPVVPALYERHRGIFEVSSWPGGKSAKLSRRQRDTVNAVLKFYGDKSAQWLSDLTHSEAPWRDAREGIPDGMRSNKVITTGAMAEYYSGL